MSPIYSARRAVLRAVAAAFVVLGFAVGLAAAFEPGEPPPAPLRPEARSARGLDRWYALEWPRREKIQELCVVTR